MLAALSDQAEQASDDWNRHKTACDTAENNAKDAEDAHLAAIKTWEAAPTEAPTAMPPAEAPTAAPVEAPTEKSKFAQTHA